MLRRKNRWPTTPLSEFPQGTFIHTEAGYFMVTGAGRRFRFSTTRVLNSWAPQRIVSTTEDNPAVKKLKVVAKMKFRNGSLLYSQADGKMYLVSDNKVRHITNPDILTGLNIARQDAVWVSIDEIKLHEEGEPLN